MNNEIKLVRYITIRYADPICSIDLTDKVLLYGTMLGTSACYLIPQKKLITLSEAQEEHISGVKIFEDKENIKNSKYIVCVGDEKIYSFHDVSENFNEIPKYEEISNYPNENEHFRRCDSCFTMLKNNYLVRTFIEFPVDVKTESKIFQTECNFKNIENLNSPEIKGVIEMSNYAVPFDFDGEKYALVDFLEEKKRIFKIHNIKNNSSIINFEIEKYKEKIGHISLLKFLKNEKMFIVRDYNKCEIRDMNFNMLRGFNLSGYEVLAFDVIYEDENNEESLNIFILDINCNVIRYNYKNNNQDYLINLENLEIDQVIKDQQFFSMGYPYYIKVSHKYMAISSDYGCIILQYSL